MTRVDLLIRETARRRPDAVAVTLTGCRWESRASSALTFAALEHRIGELAGALARYVPGPETVVAAELSGTPADVPLSLAVLRAGATLLPLDPALPYRRSALLMDRAGARVFVTDEPRAGAGPWRQVRPADLYAASAAAVTAPEPHPDALSHVIATSGSTGLPKLVGVTHRNVAAFLRVFATYGLGPDDRVARVLPPHFDVGLTETWAALAAGAQVCYLEPHLADDPAALGVALDRTGCTFAQLTASLWERLPELPLPRLRVAVTGGETPSREVVRRWSPGRRFYNAYGPTETTVCVSNQLLGVGDEPALAPGAPGVTLATGPDADRAELLIGGAMVTRGYLGRPRETAAAFRPDPATPGGRRFASGDLVERRPAPDDDPDHRRSGPDRFRVLGRVDHQVKIGGSRVDLVEVESVLRDVPGVVEAAALAVDGRLVAFVTPARADVGDCLGRLAAELPAAAVPQRVHPLPALPLTSSGKRDTAELRRLARAEPPARPAPVPAGDPRAGRGGPVGAQLAPLVARCWAELLGRPVDSLDGSWFDVGGTSLGLQRLRARLAAESGLLVRGEHLLADPTVEGMAAALAAGTPQSGEATPTPTGATPTPTGAPGDAMSPGQERLWYLHHALPDKAAFTVADLHEVRGPLSLAALRAALTRVMARHEALHTCLLLTEDGLRQRVRPMSPAEVDLRVYAADDALPRQEEEFVTARLAECFDPAGDPMLRLSVLSVGDDRHLLLLTAHHAAVDGWSAGLLRHELGRHYAEATADGHFGGTAGGGHFGGTAGGGHFGGTAGGGHFGGALPTARPYRWFAAESVARRHTTEAKLSAVALRDLLGERTPRGDLGEAGRPAVVVDLPGEPGLRDEVAAIAARAGTTPFAVLLAAVGLVVRRLADPGYDVVAVPVAGRTETRDDHSVGYYSNTLLLPLDVDGNATVADCLTTLTSRLTEALDHQDVPIQDVVETRSAGVGQPFALMFTYQNAPDRPLRLAGASVRRRTVRPTVTRAGLEFDVRDDDGLTLQVVGDASRFDEALLGALAGAVRRAVRALAEPDRPLSGIPLGDPRDPARRPVRPLPYLAVHRMVEAQAARAPHAPAVEAHDGRLDYAELDRAAGRLATGLRAHGVGPESRVVIALDRSARAVVTMLAVLKAGGAMAPVDADLPPARMARTLDVVRPALVVTETADGAPTGWPVVTGDGIDRMIAADVPELSVDVPPRAACYATFTSGSSGVPKGILLDHATVRALFAWYDQHLPVGRRVLQYTSLSFDPSLQEIFYTLSAGGAVCVPADEVRDDFVALARYVADERIDELVLPTAAVHPLAQACLDHGLRPADLRLAVVAGEQLHPGVLDRWTAELPNLTIWNHYGPAETHGVTGYVLPRSARDWPTRIPIGRPADGTRAVVLDAHDHPVPAGATGELYLGGRQVGRGYENDPRRTAERFLPDPDQPGARRYRTGDRVRLVDGELIFLGRLDGQVKIRSKRVELGDVEAAVVASPGVAQAAAVDVTTSAGETVLVAFVTADGTVDLDPHALRASLRAVLPEHMVPSSVSLVAALPVTIGGKVDRRALRATWSTTTAPPPAAPDSAAPPPAALGPVVPEPVAQDATGPEPGAPEAELLAIWRELLETPELDMTTNFFAVGGHSLLAAALVSQVKRRFDVTVPMRAFLLDPTPQGLAARIWPDRAAG
ncbi:amino acid adenylation domain-containing protein [Micromonospora sp. WMMD882]|uniref:non-ribosomal peptide synthetase n=1 Tax=Micromonospora sp. WMMD882 TaxID=3015151 RepID=UPI00248CA8B9|nr:non-ribosomal peptide synthetase [Micromonospora sp. WMMD882]WBB78075.1 amino acid adenylation domain-containing protein [Micromonospora sp. WMMD882]